MPAIQTINAIISSIQSHEILKLLFKVNGGDIGPIMNPPYLNYNGIYGIFDYLDIAKDPNCLHCGEGKVRTIEIMIDKNERIDSLFGLVNTAIGDCDPNSCLISVEMTKKTIWNPFVERLKNPSATLNDMGVEDGEILVFASSEKDPVNILITYPE
jgi:hypothetical protein